MFSKVSIFNGLIVAGVVLAGEGWLKTHRSAMDLGPNHVAVRFEPVSIGPVGRPARIVGAWAVSAADGRFGGLSALAIDHGRLLGLSDAGMLLWFDRPGTARPTVTIRALPSVPGPPAAKIGRDSEALLRDPAGRGWWVAFEQVHSLRLYDPEFVRTRAVIPIHDPDFAPNFGVEALAAAGKRIRWIPESSGASDAAALPDGRTLILERHVGPAGVRSWLSGPGLAIDLPLGRTDNPEGIVAEPRRDGGTRLWIVTDNDLMAWRRTLLVAIDLPPLSRPARGRSPEG